MKVSDSKVYLTGVQDALELINEMLSSDETGLLNDNLSKEIFNQIIQYTGGLSHDYYQILVNKFLELYNN